MKEHCDHIKDMFDGERRGIPILSVIAGLNNTYTGGNLKMFGGEDYSLNIGDVIVFPSNFMYPHAAAPVTTGVRYSYVSWVW
jgi:predicted 2-oxoglutarate/Fe(II)-dependent dioxygenase YbiX